MDVTHGNVGRISKQAAMGSSIALFVLAILAASFRTFVRWRYRKLAWLDDGFLALAVALMTVSLGLWFAMFNNLYITEDLIYDPFSVVLLSGTNIIQVAINVQTYTSVYIAISITGIFAIKFSFLFFFRSLISRLRPMVIYWRIAVAYTAFAWAISVGISFVACPYFDLRAVQCAQGNMLARALDVSIVLLVFDVSSDTLIISIPVLVLRKVKIPLQSKLYLIFTFCLSAVMIVCAILQGATLVAEGAGAIDVVWQIYFQLIEIDLAVTVVSLTAFRTFFVQRGSRNNTPRSPQNPKWYSYKRWKKSVSDRTTSTGMTGYTGYSEEMQPPSSFRAPAEPPAPATTAIETSPQRKSEEDQPFSRITSDIEKSAFSPSTSRFETQWPLSPTDVEKGPLSPETSKSAAVSPISRNIRIPSAAYVPAPYVPPPPPSIPQACSPDSSPNDVAIPIQSSDSTTSLTPMHTPLPTPVVPPPEASTQPANFSHPLSPRGSTDNPPPPSREPSSSLLKSPLTSSSYAHSAALTPRSTTPHPKPPSSSAGPRTALMGPSSTHTSRSDSFATRSNTLSRSQSTNQDFSDLEEIPAIPEVPPLPDLIPEPLYSSHPHTAQTPKAPEITQAPQLSSRSSRGMPARKPLPPSPTSTSMTSPTPIYVQQSARQNQAPLQPLASPPHTAASLAPSVTSSSTARTPRTPRSNLSPDLRISGVQRAIRNGIERAMSLEPQGGAGERW